MPAGRVCDFVSVPAAATTATTSAFRIARASHRRWRYGHALIALAILGGVYAESGRASAQYVRYHNNHRNRGYGAGVYGPGVYGGGGVGYRGPGTAQSAAQFGMARVISATGNANLMNSVATQNLAAAKSADIANRVQWTNAYYQMRQTHKAYVASNITRLSTDELNKIAHDQAPKRLDATEFNAATGAIRWPIILRDTSFIASRDDLDHLFKVRATAAGSIDPEAYLEIRRTCDEFQDELKAKVNDFSAADYERARHFIESLAAEGAVSPGDALADRGPNP